MVKFFRKVNSGKIRGKKGPQGVDKSSVLGAQGYMGGALSGSIGSNGEPGPTCICRLDEDIGDVGITGATGSEIIQYDGLIDNIWKNRLIPIGVLDYQDIDFSKIPIFTQATGPDGLNENLLRGLYQLSGESEIRLYKPNIITYDPFNTLSSAWNLIGWGTTFNQPHTVSIVGNQLEITKTVNSSPNIQQLMRSDWGGLQVGKKLVVDYVSGNGVGLNLSLATTYTNNNYTLYYSFQSTNAFFARMYGLSTTLGTVSGTHSETPTTLSIRRTATNSYQIYCDESFKGTLTTTNNHPDGAVGIVCDIRSFPASSYVDNFRLEDI